MPWSGDEPPVKRLFNRLLPKSWRSNVAVIPVIRLHGTIMAGGGQFRPSLSLASTAGLIEKAFSLEAPAVAISTIAGALNGYVLTKWRFRGANIVFGMLLLSCFIPFQIVLIPMARMLGILGIAGTIWGLILVHVVYGIGFTTLYFRNYYEAFPTELVRAAQIDGANFFQIFWRILLPSSTPIIVVSVIWQFTNIWNDFLFGVSFSGAHSMPVTVALNNLVSSSTGVKEYNVHFAGAILAALPTLIVYIVSGRYFVRGLMSGAVKG